ncbi:hypothetical protein BDN72DRAFT_962840 [Pluteus cervinus]|uniref:Uncharacterized protein n=1 Tax=Pluteus cervinus TaxID=181527 RepID=A0ACD3AHT6_9AGAR|nr:hypothetical protein BDN72DRAFT_962840 [Pluteus cervinus]
MTSMCKDEEILAPHYLILSPSQRYTSKQSVDFPKADPGSNLLPVALSPFWVLNVNLQAKFDPVELEARAALDHHIMEDCSAKHLVLRTPELISEILNHLALPISTLHDLVDFKPAKGCALRSSLLAAATCCRRFKEPALDALWRTMDSFEPILNMLPIVNQDDFDLLQIQDCTRTLWEKVETYTARIRIFLYQRSLYLRLKDGMATHVSVFNAIVAHQQFLLPGLRVLLIPSCPPEFLQSALYFVSPVLKHIEAGTNESTVFKPHELEMFVLTVSCRTDRLRHLSLFSTTVSLSPSALKALPLHTVTLNNPPKDTLLALSSLPNLKELTVLYAHRSRLDNNALGGFLALDSLSLLADAGAISQYLMACNGGLTRVRFNVIEGDGGQIKDLVDLMAKRLSQSLRRLVVVLSKRVSLNGNFKLVDLFGPLFKIPLAYVHIGHHGSGTLTTSLLDIASKLPAVRHLSLPSSAPGDAPTLSDLYGLTQTHPNISYLGTSLDVQDVLPLFLVHTQHELDTLKVHNSPLLSTNVRPVALQLDRLFPYLRILQSDGPDSSKWKEVSDFLDICHLARRNLIVDV